MNTDPALDPLRGQILSELRKRSPLDPDTPVYRIADFFSIAQALLTRRLKLTRVSTFPDRNEGVDRLVKTLVISARGEGCGGFGVHDEKSALRQVEEERQCRFVSCWSRNPESHAMWSMYSPDQTSVKVQTTIGALQDMCARALIEQWSDYYQNSTEESRRTTALLCEVDVLPAQYADLQHLLQRLSRRTRLSRRLVKDTRLDPNRVKGRNSANRWRGLLEPSVLKHKAYEYDDEIRVAFRFGWEASLVSQVHHASLTEDFARALAGDLVGLRDIQSLAKVTQPTIGATSLDFYSAPIPDGLFLSAVVDPRAPEYKRKFIEAFLEGHGVALTQSKAFGLSYTGLTAYPDKPRA